MATMLLSYLCCLYALMTTCEASFYRPRFHDSKFCIEGGGNYTTNSTYHTNLNTLLSTLTSNTQINYGFYNFSYGQNPNKVHAIGLCRGDINLDECHTCLNNSTHVLTQRCPNYKEAITYEEKCMLRYSSNSIFGDLDTYPPYYLNNPTDANDVSEFNEILGGLLRSLRDKAASGDSRRKYAADTAVVAHFETIYSVVQCTPDLSRQDCKACVDWSISNIATEEFMNKTGGLLFRPSCQVRYEIYSFLEADLALPPVIPIPVVVSPSPGKEKSNSLRTSIIIVVPVVLVIDVLLIFISIYFRRRTARKNLPAADDEDDDEIELVESLQFNLDTLQVATNNFSDDNKLGEGGFGAVYQGRLSNGQLIAVKRLSSNSGQGSMEFKNEVLLLAKLQHRNLVRLLGFSLEGKEKLLVYEFVPNKSLDFFIFDPTKRAQLDWDTRYKIVRGIARGLLYLHEDSRLRIIHRDLKASNVLLDEEMIPKIADFGMARLIVADQTQENTSRVVGTYGYMAPEYLIHGQFSVKSDVFSFGVIVLEVVSGQKNHVNHREEIREDLINFAWRNWQEGTVTNIIDPSLNNYSQNEMITCIHIGLLCVEENLANRPTMANIALMLNSHSTTLPMPSKPAFSMDSATTSLPTISWEINSGTTNTRSTQSMTRSAHESATEASIAELYPR